MFGQIGGQQGIGGPLSPDSIGGEAFIRHCGNDKLIYDFKSGSGTTVKDRSREGNDGTLGTGVAAPTWRLNGLYFDGANYVDLTGISHGISTGEFTLCFSFSNFVDIAMVFDQETIRFFVWNTSNILKMRLAVDYEVLSDSGIDAIIPIIFQITRDNSGNLGCYINSKSTNKGLSDSGDVTYDGVSLVAFGSRYNSDNNQIVGTAYSFRILNKCLSGIEAQQIYLSQKFGDNS